MGALQYIATSALSLTLSGNTGVGPFLTLFIVGVIEKSDPTLLHMDGWVETVVASWPSVVIFGCLAVLEFVGKCVPVIDEIIDSAMIFVVPILSVFGSVSSFGLFTAPPRDAIAVDIMQTEYSYEAASLGEDGKSGWLIFLQVMLCLFGVGLALIVHLFRMLLRLMGEGCCTCCITFVELSWIAVSVTICIFIVPIAIGAALLLMVAGGFGFKSWLEKRRKKEEEEEEAAATAETGGTTTTDPEEASTNENTEGTISISTEETSKSGLQEPLLP